MIPILLYHKIKDKEEDSTLCVSVEDFKKHMEYLYKEGYRTIKIDELINFYRGESKILSKSIIITFDDGYKNFLFTFPVLKN